MFSTLHKIDFNFPVAKILSPANAFKLDQSKNLSFGKGLTLLPTVKFNPFQNKPWFLHVCITSLLKTLWEKEKLLVTSNFSFSRSVFTRLEKFLPFSSNLKFSSSKSLNLEESKICHLGKG